MKKLDFKRIKNQAWYKPVSVAAVVLASMALIYGSVKTSEYMNETSTKSLPVNQGINEYTLEALPEQNTTATNSKGVKVAMISKEGEYVLDKDVEETTGKLVNNTTEQNFGTAATLEKMQYDITKNVLTEVEDHYAEVIEGATGATGEKGDKGDAGKDGKTGKTGKSGTSGTKGATGVQGAKGAAGTPGKAGEPGKDGKSTFIAYADDASGTNFSLSPTDTSKYMGTCSTTEITQPRTPSSYTWAMYRELTITYEEGTNTLRIQ